MSTSRIGEGPAPTALPMANGAEHIATANKTDEAPSAFAQVMTRLATESEQHQRAMHHALAANAVAPLDSVTLLALQSDVYRYSQTVELASKLTEQATQATQTILKSGGQ